jgi:hypothetical protein
MISKINFSKDKDKVFVSFEVNIEELSPDDQDVIESDWTDALHLLVDFGNVAVLRNSQLNLEAEEDT